MDSRILPADFAVGYEALTSRSLSDGMEGVGERTQAGADLGRASGKVVKGVGARGWRLSSGGVDVVGTRNGGSDNKSRQKVVGKTAKTLKDERALRFKQKIDKRLRRIAKEIHAFLENAEVAVERQRMCGGHCRRLGESSWLYCPNCGGPMNELDST
jgi:hypothetical protein